MFLRIARSHAQPGSLSQAQIESIRQEILTAVKRMPGFQHAYAAEDPDGSRAVIITMWDTRQHAQYDASTLGDVIGRVRDAGIQMDAPEVYEVTGQG